MGIQFGNIEQWLMFAEYEFWKVGISPVEFRKIPIKDIVTVLEIESAFNERMARYQKQQQLMSKMRNKKW